MKAHPAAWASAFPQGDRATLERALPDYLLHCRWFRGKARSIKSAAVIDVIAVPGAADAGALALIGVDYADADSETYVLPLALATGDRANEIVSRSPERMLAAIGHDPSDGVFYDAVIDPQFSLALLDMIEHQRCFRGSLVEIAAAATGRFGELRGSTAQSITPRVLKAEQSNTSVIFGDRLVLKLLRRLDAGVNPEVEIGRFLTERSPSVHVPPLAGWIDFRMGGSRAGSLAVLQAFVGNQGDAWHFTLTELDRYFAATATAGEPPSPPRGHLTELADEAEPDRIAARYIGAYLDAARLLGKRVAELHLALSSGSDDAAFAAERWSARDQRLAYQAMDGMLVQAFTLLARRLPALPVELRAHAEKVIDCRDHIAARFEAFRECRPTVARIRCHGDLHLGQVLYTGDDFVIIDFEGEPARPLAERRRKRAGLVDVAGMLRSFHYAAYTAMVEHQRRPSKATDATPHWANAWQTWSSWAFLRAYVQTAGGAASIPKTREEMRILLDAFLMEKAIYELVYELNNRPDWLIAPLQGIAQILGMEESVSAH